jgi:outer membrane protein TolC
MAVPVRAAEAEPSSLDTLIADALADNPELAGDQARWETYVHKARQAGSLDDPMLMLRIQNLLVRDPLAFDRDSTSAKVIGLSQMVPFFGKRALARETAEREAEAVGWQLEERKVELASMVKENWFRLLFIESYLAIIEKNIAILDDLSRFNETMYGVGKGMQQDVLKAQLERIRMEEMRISLGQKRRSLIAALNSLASRPAEAAIFVDSSLELTPLTLAASELEELAGANRPLLRVIAAREEKAKAMRSLAARELYPDFTVSVEYMQRDSSTMDQDGFDMYAAGVTFNIPLQHERRRAMVAESESDGRMFSAERGTVMNSIRLGIADSLAKLEGSRELARLYREGIIPQAEQTLAAVMSAYRAGREGFMAVLESRLVLFNLERDYSETMAEHQMQLARLEAIVGTSLPTSLEASD